MERRRLRGRVAVSGCDRGKVSLYPKADTPLTGAQKQYICNDENVKASLCNNTQIGEFILNANHTQSRNPIISQIIHLKDPKPVQYSVSKTGYYCVGTFGFSSDQYKAAVEFRNAYGELPAAQIAKLPFYGGLTIVYAVIAMSV
jgi:hypothetical protein